MLYNKCLNADNNPLKNRKSKWNSNENGMDTKY